MSIDDQPRTRPPLAGDELATLTGFLDHHRDTLRLKAGGLDHAALHTPLAPSTLTLGGLLHHLAFVEDYWWTYVLLGRRPAEPWASADWEADPDFELTTAPDLSRDQLWVRWEGAVTTARERLADLLRETIDGERGA